jgi:hypothetical protein
VTDWALLSHHVEARQSHPRVHVRERPARAAQRSGALASQNAPIAVLQFLRLVRQSKHESRHLFFSEDALESWLGKVSSDPENTRLAEFLSKLVEVEKATRPDTH